MFKNRLTEIKEYMKDLLFVLGLGLIVSAMVFLIQGAIDEEKCARMPDVQDKCVIYYKD